MRNSKSIKQSFALGSCIVGLRCSCMIYIDLISNVLYNFKESVEQWDGDNNRVFVGSRKQMYCE